MYNRSSRAKNYPDLQSWLELPQAEVAQFVRSRQLSLLISVDGTRRHYMLNHANRPSEVNATNFGEYVQQEGAQLAKLFDLIFSLGIKTVLNTSLLPSNFDRPDNYASKLLKMITGLFTGPVFKDVYQKHDTRARLFGDYEVSNNPALAAVRPQIYNLAEQLTTLTPAGETTLLFGVQGGTYAAEMIRRTLLLAGKLGDQVNEASLRENSFPFGPEKLDIMIAGGWLQVGGLVPPLLDGGVTDIYNLAFLALDLDEEALRRILYDHLFLRHVRTDDDLNYSSEDLAELGRYCEEHKGCVVGTGQLIGPGIWYADHSHFKVRAS